MRCLKIRIEKALNSLGLFSRIPVNAEQVYHFREEYIKNKNLIAWGFINPKNPTEMVDILLTEDLRKQKIKAVELKNEKIWVLEIEALIRMKELAARPQDLEDVRALRELYAKK